MKSYQPIKHADDSPAGSSLRCEIASGTGNGLEPGALQELAKATAKADKQVLCLLLRLVPRLLRDPGGLEQIHMSANIRRRRWQGVVDSTGVILDASSVVDIQRCLSEIEQCTTSSWPFSRNYLRDRGILRAWAIYAHTFDGKIYGTSRQQRRHDFVNMVPPDSDGMTSYLESDNLLQAVALWICTASEEGQLTDEDLSVLQVRFETMDSLSRYESISKHHPQRRSPTWLETALQVRRHRQRAAKQVHGSIMPGSNSTVLMMWATFLFSFVAVLPTFALGWRASGPLPGTTNDADFWFSVQGCCMSFLSLLTMIIPMWTDGLLGGGKEWITWLVLSIALLCTVAAPIAYLWVPTQWSAFLMTVAGSIQAWITVQIAFVARSAPKKLRDRDMKLD